MEERRSLERLKFVIAKRRFDLLAVAGLILLVVAFLSPALKDGPTYGPFDFDLSLTPLTSGLISHIHSSFNGDAVSQMIAWNSLNWQMVHHGQFPLWNQYSALGMPQFFNFESSVLSLPDLVSYLVPLRFAFLVVVAVKLVLAGVGAYLFARVLRLHPLAAFFAGVTFMLSGAFVNWVTWPLSDVACWSGWISAFGVLAYRSKRSYRYVVALAVCVAFSIYGGFPEANVMFAFVAAALIIVTGCALVVTRRSISIAGVVRVVAGTIVGIALSAPLWLPGLSVISLGHRSADANYAGLPLRSLPLLFSQGFYGLPIGASESRFQLGLGYYETVSYVGALAIVLVICGVLIAWRRPVVLGLVGALLVALAITYEPSSFHPVQNLLDRWSPLSAIRFERMRIFTGFIVAILTGVGLDALIRQWSKIHVRRCLFVGAAVTAVIMMLTIVATLQDHLSAIADEQRVSALVWPVVLVGVLLPLSLAMLRWNSALMRRLLLAMLSIGQGAFLFFAGVGIPSYFSAPYPSTPAVRQLQQIVGTSLVGLDGGNGPNVRAFAHIGFYPNVNIGYQVRLFGVHDPLIPKSYFSSWPFPSAAPVAGNGLFVPDINSIALAQRYGINYVLVAPKLVAPSGMEEVADIAGERLYRVPGVAEFSFVDQTNASVVSTSTNGDGQFVLHVDAKTADRLICRVTNVNGWHITIDNHPAALSPYQQVMFSVVVPAGRHEIVVRYWPRRLSEGLGLALGAVVVLFVYLIGVNLYVRRRRKAT